MSYSSQFHNLGRRLAEKGGHQDHRLSRHSSHWCDAPPTTTTSPPSLLFLVVKETPSSHKALLALAAFTLPS
jgi:hypothetical protein